MSWYTGSNRIIAGGGGSVSLGIYKVQVEILLGLCLIWKELIFYIKVILTHIKQFSSTRDSGMQAFKSFVKCKLSVCS